MSSLLMRRNQGPARDLRNEIKYTDPRYVSRISNKQLKKLRKKHPPDPRFKYAGAMASESPKPYEPPKAKPGAYICPECSGSAVIWHTPVDTFKINCTKCGAKMVRTKLEYGLKWERKPTLSLEEKTVAAAKQAVAAVQKKHEKGIKRGLRRKRLRRGAGLVGLGLLAGRYGPRLLKPKPKQQDYTSMKRKAVAWLKGAAVTKKQRVRATKRVTRAWAEGHRKGYPTPIRHALVRSSRQNRREGSRLLRRGSIGSAALAGGIVASSKRPKESIEKIKSRAIAAIPKQGANYDLVVKKRSKIERGILAGSGAAAVAGGTLAKRRLILSRQGRLAATGLQAVGGLNLLGSLSKWRVARRKKKYAGANYGLCLAPVQYLNISRLAKLRKAGQYPGVKQAQRKLNALATGKALRRKPNKSWRVAAGTAHYKGFSGMVLGKEHGRQEAAGKRTPPGTLRLLLAKMLHGEGYLIGRQQALTKKGLHGGTRSDKTAAAEIASIVKQLATG